MIKIILILWCGVLFACASGGGQLKVPGLRLAALQKVVEASLPHRLQKVSPNGREFFSDYFIISEGLHRPSLGGEAVRYQAKVSILGSQPPYRLDVRVDRHELRGRGYRVAGQEKKIVRVVRRRIQSKLAASRRSDVMDEFRAF